MSLAHFIPYRMILFHGIILVRGFSGLRLLYTDQRVVGLTPSVAKLPVLELRTNSLTLLVQPVYIEGKKICF